MTRNVADADAWFSYDRYVRHDRKKLVIAAMTCFDLIAAIAGRKGRKVGVKLNIDRFHSRDKNVDNRCYAAILVYRNVS